MVPKRRYLSYLRNRWWVVMICLALAVGAVVTYETLRPETYSSFAQLYITPGPQIGSIFAEPKDDFATQIELLKGSHLRRAAMDNLGSEATSHLKGSIDLDVVRPMGSSILQLRATSSDPAISQKFLQALVQEYLNFKEDTRLKTAEDTLDSLNKELALKEAALTTNQEKWAAFEKTNNLFLVQENARTASLSLAELTAQLQKLTLDLQFRREGLEPPAAPALTNNTVSAAATNSVAGTNNAAGATNAAGNAINAVANATNAPPQALQENDTALRNARIQLAELQGNREQKLAAAHGVEAAVKDLTDQIHQQERFVALLEHAAEEERQQNVRDTEKRIALIAAAIPDVEARVRKASEQLSQAQSITDDKQRQQRYYDELLTLLRSVDLNKNMAQERVTMLDAPSQGAPTLRSLPFRVFMAVVGGLCLGMGLVFVWHLVDDRVISVHDVKDQFSEPMLGILPRVRVSKTKPYAALLEPGDSRAGYLESYRHLRSALLLSSFGQGRPQTLLFTGAIPAEGKTTIAINLARLLARSGLSVALVDTDIRGGRMHEMLGKSESPGFLDFLRGQAEAKSIIYSTDVPGLSFVPVGAGGPETDGILTHANLDELMKELKTGRDFVILDSAPLLAADDASILVPYADAVILVVRPFYTRSRQTRRALEMLYQRQTRQVALVLNRASADDLAGQYYADKRKSTVAKNGKA